MLTAREKTIHYMLASSAAVIYLLAWYMAYTRGLTSTLEGESAMTAREFLRLGDWTVNHMNGLPDYDKPSLFYWLIALASLFTGGITGLAVRIPSLMASLAIMVMFRFYERNSNMSEDTALLPFLAAFIFISCPKVFWMTQMGRMDMTLNMLCFGAVTAFMLYMQEKTLTRRKKICYWLFFAASGIAVLTKGPVGILVTWPPCFLFLAFRHQWKEIRRIFAGPGLLLFLAIVLPWYVAACISSEGEFFSHFFLAENVSRFGNLWSGIEFKEFNKSAAGLYVIYLLTGFFPWSIVLPAALALFILHGRKNGVFRMEEKHILLITYAGWIFLFFSLCGVKRSDYILPLYPAAALLTADFIIKLHAQGAERYRRMFLLSARGVMYVLVTATATVSTAVLAVSSGVGRAILSPMLPRKISTHLEWFSSHLYPTVPLALSACVFAAWLLIRYGKRHSRFREIAVLTGISASTWLVTAGAVLPFIDNCKDMRPYCKNISEKTAGSPLYSYHFWDEECAFYLDRDSIPRINEQRLSSLLNRRDKRVFILVREKEMRKLRGKAVKIPWVSEPGPQVWRKIYLISNMDDRAGRDLSLLHHGLYGDIHTSDTLHHTGKLLRI